jgi:conjugal transfer pilus assembly protein TraK
MRNLAKLQWALLAPTLALANDPSALALQSLEVADGVTVDATISTKEATRIRIEGSAITNVFGNIYSSNCGGALPPPAASLGATPQAPPVNPAGEIVLECDSDKGEIYVRPVGPSAKPVNLFVSSSHATYTLLLRKTDTPADTIVIHDKTPFQARPQATDPSGTGRQPQHVKSLKGMLIAMASDRVPTDMRVEEVNRPIQLWNEATFALQRTYEGRGLIGERYLLTNVSNDDMVVAEQEFDRENAGVVAVAIDHHNLRPGESTAVYVIRAEGGPR